MEKHLALPAPPHPPPRHLTCSTFGGIALLGYNLHIMYIHLSEVWWALVNIYNCAATSTISFVFEIHSSMLLHIAVLYSLLLFCGIPLYEYTTVYYFVVNGHLSSFQVWAFMNSTADFKVFINLEYVKCYLIMVLIRIFLIANKSEHFFIYLLAINLLSFVKCLLFFFFFCLFCSFFAFF